MISPIFEKTLNREIEHIKNDEFAILTAWRGALSATKNLERMRQIQRALSTYNFGFVKMDGVGQEVGGESVEKSLLVLNGRKTPNFKQMMIDLAAQFDQDFLVYGKGGKSELLDQSGTPVQTFSNVEAGVDQFYSKVASGAFHLVENNTNMNNFKSKSEVVGISEAVNPRIKALQDQLSKVVKTPVEITIRGEKEFTVTCEGNNVQAINAVKTFLGNQAQWGEIGYDQEGDISFGYFTIVEMAIESIVESSMRIVARYFREKPWSSIKESVKVELQKIAKSKPGTRTYESAIMNLAGITSGKPDLIKNALAKFVLHESALSTLTEGGAEDQYKMYDKLDAEGFKLAEASRCIMSAMNTDGKAEIKDLERYVEKFTRLGKNNPKESSFGRTYGEIADEYRRAIDFIKSGKHKNLMNESVVNEGGKLMDFNSMYDKLEAEGFTQSGFIEDIIKAVNTDDTAKINKILKSFQKDVDFFTNQEKTPEGRARMALSVGGPSNAELVAQAQKAIDLIKSGKHKEMLSESAINEEKFTLINVTKSEGGKVIGSWVQNHIGTLETAIQAAKDTEAANGNKLDIAVVPDHAGATPITDMGMGLQRLDTQRVMNPDKMFGEGKVNESGGVEQAQKKLVSMTSQPFMKEWYGDLSVDKYDIDDDTNGRQKRVWLEVSDVPSDALKALDKDYASFANPFEAWAQKNGFDSVEVLSTDNSITYLIYLDNAMRESVNEGTPTEDEVYQRLLKGVNNSSDTHQNNRYYSYNGSTVATSKEYPGSVYVMNGGNKKFNSRKEAEAAIDSGSINEGVLPQNVDNWIKTEGSKELRDSVLKVKGWLDKAGLSIRSGSPAGPKPQNIALSITSPSANDMLIKNDGTIRFFGETVFSEGDLMNTLKANESKVNESKKFTGNENPDDLFDGEYVTSTGKPIDEQLPDAHKDYTKADHLEASQFHYIRAGHMEDMAENESDEEAIKHATKFKNLASRYEAAAKSVRESIQAKVRARKLNEGVPEDMDYIRKNLYRWEDHNGSKTKSTRLASLLTAAGIKCEYKYDPNKWQRKAIFVSDPGSFLSKIKKIAEISGIKGPHFMYDNDIYSISFEGIVDTVAGDIWVYPYFKDVMKKKKSSSESVRESIQARIRARKLNESKEFAVGQSVKDASGQIGKVTDFDPTGKQGPATFPGGAVTVQYSKSNGKKDGSYVEPGDDLTIEG